MDPTPGAPTTTTEPTGGAPSPGAAPDASMGAAGADSGKAPAQGAGPQRGPDGKFIGGKPAEVAPAPRREKIRYKVDGQDVEEEVDFDHLIGAYRKSKAADRRFEEAAQLRKQGEQEILTLREKLERAKNPKELARIIREEQKADPLRFFEEGLHALLEEEAMTPEQRELAKYREQERLAAEAKAKQDEDAAALKEAEEVDQHLDRLGGIFKPALEKTGLPLDDVTFALMAGSYESARRAGIDIDEHGLAQATFDAAVAQQNAILTKLGPKGVRAKFPAVAKAIIADYIEELQAKRAAAAQNKPPAAAPSRAPAPDPITTSVRPPAKVRERDLDAVFGIK